MHALIALALAAAAAASPVPEPEAAARAACRPQVTALNQTYVAGTAFLLDHGGRTLLVTAHHVFGTGGGLSRDLDWRELPAAVAGVRCAAFSDAAVWRAGPALAIPGAAAGTDVEALKDVAALAVQVTDADRGRALRLAPEPAKVGDRVWLVTSLVNGAPESQLLHPAKVTRLTGGGTVLYVYDNRALDIRATSGAAVVNTKGEVVGVNFGGGERQGYAFGIATGVEVLRAGLAAADGQR